MFIQNESICWRLVIIHSSLFISSPVCLLYSLGKPVFLKANLFAFCPFVYLLTIHSVFIGVYCARHWGVTVSHPLMAALQDFHLSGHVLSLMPPLSLAFPDLFHPLLLPSFYHLISPLLSQASKYLQWFQPSLPFCTSMSSPRVLLPTPPITLLELPLPKSLQCTLLSPQVLCLSPTGQLWSLSPWRLWPYSLDFLNLLNILSLSSLRIVHSPPNT